MQSRVCPLAARLHCAHPQFPLNELITLWSRMLQGQLMFANHEQASFSGLEASYRKVRWGGGEEEGGGKGHDVWEAKKVLDNLWMAQPVTVGSHRPDLPQAELQGRVWGPLSPGSPETPRCRGENPGAGGCPEYSSHTHKVCCECGAPPVSITNTSLLFKVT